MSDIELMDFKWPEKPPHDPLIRIKQTKVNKAYFGKNLSTNSMLQYKHGGQWWDVPVEKEYIYLNCEDKGIKLNNV